MTSQAVPTDGIFAAVCFHCGLPQPAHADFFVEIDGVRQPMCCPGCAAVAQAIVNGGLSDYYQFRTAAANSAREVVPEFLRQTLIYDHPAIQKNFVRAQDEHVREAALILEGITCAACVWLNERHVARLPGVLAVHINYATQRARVTWDERRIHLSDILQAVSRIGYLAHPFDPGRHQQRLENERKLLLRRLGVAGVMTMQVMILAEALYVGDWLESEMQFRHFFHWVSLLLTLPVLLYSAQPFFTAAWRDLKNKQAGMDVPVSLGIVTAFGASLWATLTGVGAVYYDSVVMFVFFLLCGRYFEAAARQRASEAAESLVQATPALATRLTSTLPSSPSLLPEGEGSEPRESLSMTEIVTVAELRAGDQVRILPGEVVPADGVVLQGRSSVNESLLTGESLPLTKIPGQTLIGGSINIESPLIARVEKTGPDTILSAILRLMDRAAAEKPRIALLADRVAAWFVIAVLMLASITALYWWQHDPTLWLPASIAVLVITCPCALSLATPAALTAATDHLTHLGLLVTRASALETWARATHFIFDKTGTLTQGQLHLRATHCFSDSSAAENLTRASALERHSEHPIARALLAAAEHSALEARQVMNTPGAGICGNLNGETFFLGTPLYIHEQTGLALDTAILEQLRQQGATVAVLAEAKQLHAAFVLDDELRPGARALIDELKRHGLTIWLLTGDHEKAAQRVADALGIENIAWEQKPADKLTHIKALQQQGAIVAMVGDGINDAPVLAAAQVSIAMGGGTALAAASADMILLSQKLSVLGDGLKVARRGLAIIRQNLIWALAYNVVAIPAAAAGYVAPWVAALGMSLSSLLVVANALRLTKRRADRR